MISIKECLKRFLEKTNEIVSALLDELGKEKDSSIKVLQEEIEKNPYLTKDEAIEVLNNYKADKE